MLTTSYSDFQSQLNRVRAAWKRAAAIQGFAIVTIEAIGMFLLFLLLDYIYVLPQTMRIASMATIGACLAVLFGRHVIRPLMRNISDDQIALYIEERQQESQGALLSAAAFGKSADGNHSPVYAFIVESIIQSAVLKAGGIQLAKVLNLSRLRKYTLAAVALLLLIGLSAVRYSHFFGRHANRLLMPWEMSEEDLRSTGALVDAEPRTVFELTFDPHGPGILRGAALSVKARLNRPASEDVFLHFRSKGGAAFQKLKMTEIEEVNSFAIRLPDINDDLELFVRCGKNASETVTIAVYDALELKGFDVVVVPPAYTQWETRVESGQSADVSALVGSHVKLRALSNVPLSEGELRFSSGEKVALKIDPKCATALLGEFTIEKDASFSVAMLSFDKQSIESPATYVIKALPDQPPTVSLTMPGSDMAVHASAEVNFAAKVGDDVGVKSAELICNFSSGGEEPVRMPFRLEGKPAPGEREVSLVLPLADLGRNIRAGDSVLYHVAVTDLKGQTTLSDLFMLEIRSFEVAMALPKKGGHAPDHEPFANLIQFISAAWNIHVQREHAPKSEYDGRCENLAGKIVQVDRPHLFEGAPGKPSPEVQAVLNQAYALVQHGVEDLKQHDAGKAVADLSRGLMFFKKVCPKTDGKAPTLTGKKYADFAADPMQAALGSVEISPPPIPEDDPPFFNHPVKPDYIRQTSAQNAREMQKAARQLKKRQEEIVNEAKKLAANDKGGAGGDEENPPTGANAAANQAAENKDKAKNPENAAKGGAQPPAQQQAGAATKPDEDHGKLVTAGRNERAEELRRKQDQLAEDIRGLAQQMAEKMAGGDKNTQEAVDEFRKSAAAMQDAAGQMKEGNMQQAAAHGERAALGLNKAAEKLDVMQFKFLEDAVEAAEDRTARIAETQAKIKEAAERVLEEARKRNQANGNAGPANDVKLNAQERQKIKGLANWQAENQKNADNLEEYINDLAKWAAGSQRKETAEQLQKAAKAMKQENPSGTMVNATVNMSMLEMNDATEALNKIDKALQKVGNAVRAANGSLAQNREQKLKRALDDTKEMLARAQQLSGAGDEKGREQATRQQGDNKEKGDAQKGDPNAEPKPAKPGENLADGKAMAANGSANGGARKGEPNDKNTAQPTNAEEKRRLQDELYHDTVRLMHRIEKDQLVDSMPKDLQEPQATGGKFGALFKENDHAQLVSYLESLRGVTSNLESKLESVLKGKRLSASMREQTPSEYRDMVNQYYAQLAKQ